MDADGGMVVSDRKPVAIVTHWEGIAGLETVLYLAEKGFQVVANATEDQLLMAGAGAEVLSCEFDPTTETAVHEKFDVVLNMFGQIDVLVNNPLEWTDAALEEITETMWADVMNKNMKSTFYCSRAVAKPMLTAQRGRIINLTSTAGITGAHTPFAASCAAVMSLTRSLAIELAPHVQVNCIATGILDEPWVNEAGPEFRKALEEKVPLRRLCRASDVAALVHYLASDSSFFTAQTFSLDGGETSR